MEANGSSNASSAAAGASQRSAPELSALSAAVLLTQEPRSSVKDDYNDIGIPVAFLWLPYTTLSFCLVGLMLVSFIRFHFKHGHKYRRRREQFCKQLNVQDILQGQGQWQRRFQGQNQSQYKSCDQGQCQGHVVKGRFRPSDRIEVLAPGTPVPHAAWSYPTHPFHTPVPRTEFTPQALTQQEAASGSRGSTTNNRRREMSPVDDGPKFRRQRSLLEQFRESVYPQKRKRTRALPIAFNSNLNGSMVNVRCGENESLNTFRTFRCLDVGAFSRFRQLNRDEFSQLSQLSRDEFSQLSQLNRDEFRQPNRDGICQLNRDEFSQPNRDSICQPNRDEIRLLGRDEIRQPNRDGFRQLSYDEFRQTNRDRTCQSNRDEFRQLCQLNRDSLRQPNRNRTCQSDRDGSLLVEYEDRRSNIWTVQSEFKPKLLSTVSGTFCSSNSAIAEDETYA